MKKNLLLLIFIITTSVYTSDHNHTEKIHANLSDGHTHTSACGHKDMERLEELKKENVIQITKTELIVDSVKLGDYIEKLEEKHAGTNLNLEILAISRVLQTYSDEKKLDLIKKGENKNKV